MVWSFAVPCILVFLVLIAIAAAVAGTAGYRRAAARGSKVGMAAGGCVGAAGLVLMLCLIAYFSAMVYSSIWPAAEVSPPAFFHAFGFAAAEDEVTQIRNWFSTWPEPHQQRLRFHAPPEIIAKVTRGRFQRASVEDCRRRALASGRDAPEWWTPSPAPQAECYVAEPFTQDVRSSAWLLYDRGTGEAYFHYLAHR